MPFRVQAPGVAGIFWEMMRLRQHAGDEVRFCMELYVRLLRTKGVNFPQDPASTFQLQLVDLFWAKFLRVKSPDTMRAILATLLAGSGSAET